MNEEPEHKSPAPPGDGEETSGKLGRKQLAQAKLRARKLRIGSIRKRVAVTASVIVAFFSGALLVRSMGTDTGPDPAAAASQAIPAETGGDPGGSVLGTITSVFQGDDDHDDHDDDHGEDHGDDDYDHDDHGDQAAAADGSRPQASPAGPGDLVTGQS